MTPERESAADGVAGALSSKDTRAAPAGEPMFQSVVERIRDVAIFVLDPQGVIRSWNIGAAQLTGYRRSEVIDRHVSLLYDGGQDGQSGPAQRWTGTPGGRRFEDEIWIQRKDGSRFWADVSVSALVDEAGVITGYAVIARDRSERRAADEARRRLTAILDSTTDFVGFADPEGRVQYINPAGRAILGIGSEEDVTALGLADVHPAWATGVLLREAIPTILERGAWSGDTALLARDGREIAVHQVLVAHKGTGREIDFVSTIARDITDRKRAEERQDLILEASRRLSASLDYQTTLQNVVEAVIPRLADWCVIAALDDDEIRWVATWHGEKRKRDPLARLRDQSEPLDPEAPVGLHRVLASGEAELVPQVSEQWLKAAVRQSDTLQIAGDLGIDSAMLVPLIARGRTLGAIAFIYGGSTRRYDQSDLELAQELAGRAALFIDNAGLFRAELEAVRIRDEVLSIVAHDLRNPLSRILMVADFLLEISSMGETERRQLEIVRRAAGGMNRLIQDLLEVARMESGGGLALDRERRPVTDLLGQACEMFETQAQEKGLALVCVAPPDGLMTLTDPHRFLQVMSNLIGNAIKFTDQGKITVRAEPADTMVSFSVEDTGPGIPEEERVHIFDRFWQAQHSRRGGAGLGLAITRGIVDAHGGRIWVESIPGGGTRFAFTLPRG